jgi:hypothetical protein
MAKNDVHRLNERKGIYITDIPGLLEAMLRKVFLSLKAKVIRTKAILATCWDV